MKKLIEQGCGELGLAVTDKQIQQLCDYADLLVEWNEKMNLTAITEPSEIVTKHFFDSMTALLTERVRGSVIDVGTGAGFPGMVLKIMRPDIELTLLDSLAKRLTFLKAVSDKLGIDDITFIHSRAEDGGRNARLRGKFDAAVSRAVANMTALSEFCLPFVKQNGYFLALKGPAAQEELDGAKRAIAVLGGETDGVFEAQIPFTELSHKIIMIKKVRQTPMQYPRKAGIPTKSPIGGCYNLKKGPK